MTTVAFIGLGIMGGPMAANLVKAGFDVVGYNRSPEKVKELVEKGGRGAEDVASAVAEADVVITMVPDSPDVEDVTGGADGVFANAREGALYKLVIGAFPNHFKGNSIYAHFPFVTPAENLHIQE